MALLLHIETATKNCAIALSEDDQLLYHKEFNDGNYSHSEKVHVFIQEVLKEAHKSIKAVDAVAVSMGPGSFTGLRIGVSTAKGLCFALDKPLIAVSTLTSLSNAIVAAPGDFIVPLLDARRMEVYSAVFNNEHQEIREIKAEVITENSFSEYLSKGKVHFLGDGAAKCKDLIVHTNAVYHDDIFPSAKQMVVLASTKYQQEDFENVAYFEPFYLKDFLITPKKTSLP